MTKPAHPGVHGRMGQHVAGRFVLEVCAGSGGGGAVYQARDLMTGERVALKVLHGVSEGDFARFAREAKALAALKHPNVVRYVTHGIDETQAPYLAMEWLEGEDLRARLAREPLGPRESVTLARGVAETLAAVHERGFLHRDIKPGNLFLLGGQVDRVKVLDFGLVRSHFDTASLTHTGMLVGTLGYIAPEQARGSRGVDLRADIFSLGCVLYKCLSGEAPFEGPNLIAVMTKVILEEPRPLREARPDLPRALTDLVHRMLDKEPGGRPADMAAVAAALAEVELGQDEGVPDTVASVRFAGLTGRELRAAAVLLIGAAGAGEDDLDMSHSGPPRGSHADIRDDMLERFVAEQKGRIERLADGMRVVTMGSTGAAPEQAAWAARCALSLRSMFPSAPMALAMGGREASGATPIGGAIDRATVLLGGVLAAAEQAAEQGRPPPAWVAIDEATASVLDSRFDVRRSGELILLFAVHDSGVVTRKVLGKATPIVGRDWELSSITSLFRECVEAPSAASVLVTAPAGLGKSRLAGELIARFHDIAPGVEVWTAHGDSVYSGAPLHLLRLVLASAMSLGDAGPLDERVKQIRARVARSVDAENAPRVAEMLGEIVKVPFPDGDRPGLRAARADARIMGEQTRAAWEAFLAAESAAHPVVIVLDDLQWGDLPSLLFIEGALRRLDEKPVLVLMLGRPDVVDHFPRLPAGASFQEIRLRPLTPKASERLVLELLGPSIGADARARLVARAEGNAFYLEELMRALAERRGGGDPREDTLPETVLVSVQSRLGALDDETRRLLRAASVFGEVFWANGVTALLGGTSIRSIGPWLDALAAQEILVRRPESRFPGESELAFRHTLVREAAYAMLTEEDRALGHQLAGLWLEQRGEGAMALAFHFERGGDVDRAAMARLRAAEEALRGLDLDKATSLAEGAAGAGAPDDLRAQALATLCDVYLWRLEWEQAAAAGDELRRLSTRGSSLWIRARTIQLSAALVFARPDQTMEALFDLMSVDPTPESAPHHATAIAAGVFVLAFVAQFAALEPFLAKLAAIDACAGGRDLVVRGWRDLAHTQTLAWRDGDARAAMRHAEAACAAFTEAGDRKNAAFARVFLAMTLLGLGAIEAAGRALEEVRAQEPGEMIAVMQSYYHALVALAQGAFETVAEVARGRTEDTAASDPMRPIRVAEGHFLRSEVLRRTGDFEGAEKELAPALDALRPAPLTWQLAAVSLARTRLALGRTAEALSLAREALAAIGAHGGEGFQGMLIRLTCVEALDAAGAHAEARELLRAAHARLLDLSARIPESDLRASFLGRVEENARIVTLAAEFGLSSA